jgi:hypothetical protein
MENEKGDNKMFIRSPTRQPRRPIALAVILTSCFFIYLWTVSQPIHIHLCGDHAGSIDSLTEKHLVPLEAHIMSKCPDAKVRPPASLGCNI